MDILKFFLNCFVQNQEGKMKFPLVCPQCKKEHLNEWERHGIKIYVCSICGGSFLGQESLNNLLNFQGEEEWPELFQLVTDTEHTYSRSGETRFCPGCDSRMDNMQFQYNSSIWVDYCPKGHGVWLDSGEMRLVKDYYDHSSQNKELSDEEKNNLVESFKTVDHTKDPTYRWVQFAGRLGMGGVGNSRIGYSVMRDLRDGRIDGPGV